MSTVQPSMEERSLMQVRWAPSITGVALAPSAGEAADSSSVDSPEILRSCDNPESADTVEFLWSSGQPCFLVHSSSAHR